MSYPIQLSEIAYLCVFSSMISVSISSILRRRYASAIWMGVQYRGPSLPRSEIKRIMTPSASTVVVAFAENRKRVHNVMPNIFKFCLFISKQFRLTLRSFWAQSRAWWKFLLLISVFTMPDSFATLVRQFSYFSKKQEACFLFWLFF